jgi:hypothetical protein
MIHHFSAMKPSLINLLWILILGSVNAATVAFNQNSVDDADASTIGAVSANEFRETGTSYSTVSAPASFSNRRFTHWTNSSYPSTVYRDAWGRSLNPISFTLQEATTCTARYLPVARDSDSDGVPDWYEIEYFGNLDRAASFDGDDDGIQLSAEYIGGSHPLYGNASQAGGVSYADSALVSYNKAAYPSYVLRSIPAGTVNQTTIAPPGTVVTTSNLSANASFGYWTLDGVRQMDAWGVALPQITFIMGTVNREAVAYLFADDKDTDTLPDAYEQYYYGTLNNDETSDTDGDGISLLAERSGGTNPLHANASQNGGVAWADSAMVTVNLAGFSRYTFSSLPVGAVNQSAVVPDGTVITTPNMTQSTFGYWALDGVRQQDAWGTALRQLTFTVNGTDRSAVAYLFDNDSDSDGISDGYEQYHFHTLANDSSTDADGDGIPLLAEFTGGTNPLYGNFSQQGGVSWADSPTVVVNLQPYERLSKMLIDGVLTDFFSPNPAVITGLQAGTQTATAMTDWDGDGDGDLFIAHEGGLRVLRNIGSPNNPNFQEIFNVFSGLADYIATIDKPILAGGDWNGDGKGDLVIGGNTSTLRLIVSGGAFTADGSGVDFTVASATAAPALGDMNGDGRADLLVLMDDGSASLFLNNGTSEPFSGSGSSNYLGTSALGGTSIAIGDINQDGMPDVLLADNDGRIWEFLNNGSGGFSLQSKVWGGSFPGFASGLTLAAADLEGDGDLDLIGGLANGGIVGLRDPNVGRPTGLVFRPGAGSVQLDWNASWQSRIRGYYIYRSAALAGPWGKVLPTYVPLPSFLDTSVDSVTPNYYQITGESYFFLPGNSTPRIVESLPSDPALTKAGKVILSVRPAHGNPGDIIKINLAIENATGISGTGMQLRVAYDPAMLQPVAQVDPTKNTVLTTGISGNLSFTDNSATATGELVINGTAGKLESGTGKFFTLQFQVATNALIGSSLGVAISNATMFDLSGNGLSVEITQLNPLKSAITFNEGDISGDGMVTAADKTLLIELIQPNSRPPTANELMAGDLNGDGQLDVKDCVLLIQLLNVP